MRQRQVRDFFTWVIVTPVFRHIQNSCTTKLLKLYGPDITYCPNKPGISLAKCRKVV